MSEYFSVIKQHATNIDGVPPIKARHTKTCISSDQLILRELPLCGQFNLRLNPDNTQQMEIAADLIGGPLPTKPLTSSQYAEVRVIWIAPDDWLVIMPWSIAADFESRYRAAQTGHYSIVDISAGQTLVELSGPESRNVLKKASPIDVHPQAFPIDKCVSTVFAKSAAGIVRTGDDSYLLVVRRSFADYIWDWLTDASAEYRA